MARKYRTPATPLTPAERTAYEKAQAEERQKRGLVTFTRPDKREAVFGRTLGESRMSSSQRNSQATQRTDEANKRGSRQKSRSSKRGR